MRRTLFIAVVAAIVSVASAAIVHAEIRIGATLGATGPNASLGIHYKNAFQLMPTTIAGHTIKYIVMEDGSDATTAGKNIRKLISEDKVDAIMGSTSVPISLLLAQLALETKTPFVCLSPLSTSPDKYHWSFITPQQTELMMGAIAAHMKKNNVKTVGFIGYADGWGDLMLKATEHHAAANGYQVVTNERYARADTSVTGQVLKIMSANPDVVVVGATGTGAALPHTALIERGYKGQIYHSHGTVNAEFIKIGGKSVEGAIATTGPLMVAEDLPENHPTRAVSIDFVKRYETGFGAGARNALSGYTHDGVKLLLAAIPDAVKKAEPGTPEFRLALRDALENVKNLVGAHGVYTMTPENHNGLDERARVLVRVDNAAWRLLKP